MAKNVIIYSEYDDIEFETDSDTIKKSNIMFNKYNECLENINCSVIKIVVSDIPSCILKLILEWLEKMKKNDKNKQVEELISTYVKGSLNDSWEEDYFNRVYNNRIDDLFQFISAAELLQIPDLVNLASIKVANLLKDLNENQIEELLSIED